MDSGPQGTGLAVMSTSGPMGTAPQWTVACTVLSEPLFPVPCPVELGAGSRGPRVIPWLPSRGATRVAPAAAGPLPHPRSSGPGSQFFDILAQTGHFPLGWSFWGLEEPSYWGAKWHLTATSPPPPPS